MIKIAKKIVKVLQKNGYEAVFAGGCVRDMLLGIEPHDYDIATSATPDVVESLFKHTKAVGKAFGVILVRMKGVDFEVATFRKDGNYSDGRRPDTVSFSTMKEDAERRDFTANAMFYDPIKKEVIDYVYGISDLTLKTLRFVGNANHRIEEDHLRLLRAVRFALKLDFELDPSTFEAIRRNAYLVNRIAPERVREEFVKILEVGKPRRMMDLLFSTHLMQMIFPEIVALKDSPQYFEYHPEGDVLEHTILVMEKLTNQKMEVQLAGMFHDIGKPNTLKFEDGKPTNKGHDRIGADTVEWIMLRLKFSNDEITLVRNLVADHMKHHIVKEFKKSTLKRYMALPYIDELILLNRADCLSASGNLEHVDFLEEKMNEFEPEEIKPIPFVNGHDLTGFGLKPGPVFKILLDEMMDFQLEDIVINRKQALKVLKEKVNLIS